MAFPELYLSAPAIDLPRTRLDNEQMIARVRADYRGEPDQWPEIETRIRGIFRLCGSRYRYREEDAPFPVASHAIRAAERCLAEQSIAAGDLQRVIYGGISREYFEPAMAAEVAGRMGAHDSLPYDVVGACAGTLLGIHSFAADAALDPDVQRGLVCTAGVSTHRITTSIQSVEDALHLGAGLTVGNAAAAMLLSRAPMPACGRLLTCRVEGFSRHWNLCRAPIDGHFTAESIEIFRLSRPLTAAHVQETLRRVGWAPGEVDHVISHQPSHRVILDIARSVGLRADRTYTLHDLYGNTEAASVPISLRHAIDNCGVKRGDKLLMVGVAGGLLIASAALVWQ